MTKQSIQDSVTQVVNRLNKLLSTLQEEPETIELTVTLLQIESLRQICKSNAELLAPGHTVPATSSSLPNTEQFTAAADYASDALRAAERKDAVGAHDFLSLMLDAITDEAKKKVTAKSLSQIDGQSLDLETAEFFGENGLRVRVGTSCPKGTRNKETCRTLVSFEGLGNATVRCLQKDRKIELVFSGDNDCETAIQALHFAARTLRKLQADNGRQMKNNR